LSWAHSKKERIGGQAVWRALSRKIDIYEQKVRKRLEAQVKVFTKEEIEEYLRTRTSHGKP
jgi:hypothetical protein